MKNHDSSSPFRQALAMKDQFALFMAGVFVLMGALLVFMLLPTDAQIVIGGIVSLVGVSLVAHLLHERIKAMSGEHEEVKVDDKKINLHFRDVIAKERSNMLQKQKMELAA